MNVLIVGRGRVGGGLARALEAVDSVAVDLVGRRIPAARVECADVVVLAVSDEDIEAAAAVVAKSIKARAVVLHCAGARGLEALSACEARGCAVGVMHPLVSFPSKRAAPSLAGTTFTVHGKPRAVAAARAIAKSCGARAVSARTGDPAYHAAAALVANGAVGLAYAAVGVLEGLGFGRRDAERAVGGLLRTVADNVQQLGVPRALTGPVARGEPDTIARHRAALHRDKAALSSYDAVLPIIVRCARAAGLPGAKAREILSQVRR
jgi:predicted short-subunit dehydrogenase-like oxidoreductase (DUF2520 family)